MSEPGDWGPGSENNRNPLPPGEGELRQGARGPPDLSPPPPSWLFLVKSAEAPLLGEGCEAHLGRVSGSHLAV